MDITSRARTQPSMETTHSLHSTTPGSVSLSPGGVGRNIGEATHRILSNKSGSQAPVLISLIGEDVVGGVLRNELLRIGMRTDGLITIPGEASAVCNMVLDTGGGLITGVADMDIIESLEGNTVSLSPSQPNYTNHCIRVGHGTVESVQPESGCVRRQSEGFDDHRHCVALR